MSGTGTPITAEQAQSILRQKQKLVAGLKTMNPEDWLFKNLPEYLSVSLKTHISEFFNEGRSGEGVNPVIPDEQLSDNDISIIWAAFQAGRELKEAARTEAAAPQTIVQPAALPPSKEKELKNIDVDAFEGDKNKFQEFATQLAIMFAGAPETYSTEMKKMIATYGKLKGPALKWASNHLDLKTMLFNFPDYNTFMTKLGNAFDDPSWKDNATRNLLNLTQTTTCVKYYTDFLALSTKLGWNQTEFLIALFQKGLKGYLKDAMANSMYAPPSDSLEAFGTWCISLDEKLTARWKEKDSARRPDPPKQKSQKSPVFSSSSHETSQQPSAPAAPQPMGDPMQVDQVRLPFKFKNGAVNYGHCWKCGQKGHRTFNCRDKKPGQKINQASASGPVTMTTSAGDPVVVAFPSMRESSSKN